MPVYRLALCKGTYTPPAGYTVVRTARKSIAIHITPAGMVEVRAPRAMPRAAIDRFVQEKAGWIARKLAEVAARNALRAVHGFSPGYTLPFLGREYPVRETSGPHALFDGECFLMPHGLTDESRSREAERLYRTFAREWVQRAVARYAPIVGAWPAGVGISGARTRWGSCSAKGRLNFSYRLMFVPEDAADYVVVHELAHLIEHNHSVRFWAQVERVLPDRKAREALLKTYGNAL